jgi:7-carboxy-7-deazaguanine synthase
MYNEHEKRTRGIPLNKFSLMCLLLERQMELMTKSADIPGNTLLISEIFHSLQGEGPWAGLPASFIRLAGCLEPFCPWCDTPYALGGGQEVSLGEILSLVAPHPASRVVITGGEPFLQWDRGLSGLHGALRVRGREIQYETSGKAGVPPVEGGLVVCSPKLVDGAWQVRRLDPARVDFFKFLAGGEGWPGAVEKFIEEYGIERDRVHIMALGATREEQIRGMEAVFRYCVERGYRMSPRLHVLAFDARRGV